MTAAPVLEVEVAGRLVGQNEGRVVASAQAKLASPSVGVARATWRSRTRDAECC